MPVANVYIYASPAEGFEALEAMYCSTTVEGLVVRRLPTVIAEQLLDQCGHTTSSGDFCLNLTLCKTLGAPQQYYGNAGVVALGYFIKKYLPRLDHLCLAGALRDHGLTNPRGVTSDVALSTLLRTLEGYPLSSIDLSGIVLGAQGYRVLTHFIKKTPSVSNIVLQGCELSDCELRGITIFLEQSAKRPPGKDRVSGRCDRNAVGFSLSSRSNPYTFTPCEIAQLLSRPPKKALGVHNAVDGLSSEMRANVPAYLWEDQGIQLAVAEGFAPQRKDSETSARLRVTLRAMPTIAALLKQCFPRHVESAMGALVAGSGMQGDLRAILGVGPSLDEEDALRIGCIQQAQSQQVIDFIVDSLQFASCVDGDVLIDVGDTPQWVSFVEHPSSAYFEVCRGGEVVATFPANCFVGEHEMLSKLSSRVYEVRVRSPDGGPIHVWQLSREIYQKVLLPFLLEQRRISRRAVEMIPSLGGLPNVARLALCHVLTPITVDIGSLNVATQAREVVVRSERLSALGDAVGGVGVGGEVAEDLYASFPIMSGDELAQSIVIVEEGTVVLRKGISDLRTFTRGNVIFIQGDGLATNRGMLLVSAPIRLASVQLQVMPTSAMQVLPSELREALCQCALRFSQ